MLGGDGFLSDVVASGGFPGFVAGFGGGVHLTGEGGGEFEFVPERFFGRIDSDDTEWQGFAYSDELSLLALQQSVTAARGIALREVPLESGRCDYLLLVDRVPLGVIETKKEGTTLSTVSEQSAHYGGSLLDSLANLLPGTKQMPLASETTGVETL